MPVSTDPAAADFPSSRVRTRAEAEAYVASVCFKHGPPRLLGVELEWTVHHSDDPTRTLDPATLIAALGPHAPRSLVPDSPRRKLPNGSVLTVEPGGQVEVSSLPTTSMRSLFEVVAADAEYVERRLRAAGLVLGDQGTDPWRYPNRILQVPRYAAMETAFDRIGLDGRLMMCSTAGVQVCLDAGEPDRVAARWAALHALGPVMMAMFANSPMLFGERTGWVSTRTRALLRTDPPRTRPGPITVDPAAAKRVLDTAIVCQRRDNGDWTAPSGVSFAEWIHGALPDRPTRDDLDYHLSTVFPPVRPRGYFEVRYLDAQPGQDWMLPAGALIALFREESTVDKVLSVASPAVGRWVHAARHGLRDRALARTARDVFGLACRHLQDLDSPPGLPDRLADFVAKRLAAADER
ncbi:glutamate-cysteine ligase family protein [Saccharopolyspora spinosa]|uniref:glutamate-cysteine ligase family protein n=1 Tax=Saccharopolyspora spinosa TaxID=60894 RepID=UPI00376F01FD